jgi:hypothetical protein
VLKRWLDLDHHLNFSTALEEQIDLGAVFGSIVIGRAPVTGGSNEIVDDEPFSARPRHWVTQHVFPCLQIE